jgi:hypothetical protein
MQSSVSYHKINITDLLYPGCADSSTLTTSENMQIENVRLAGPEVSASQKNARGHKIMSKIPPRVSKPIAGLPSSQEEVAK